jgi:hypothetical protein
MRTWSLVGSETCLSRSATLRISGEGRGAGAGADFEAAAFEDDDLVVLAAIGFLRIWIVAIRAVNGLKRGGGDKTDYCV